MSRIQNGKNRNPEKPISGCLGRMVNLFDLNTGLGGNKLLTDKPHHDGNGTPIKMLIAQEMSKEDECKQSPSNLVAKLMGLDALPQQHQQPVSASCRSHSRHSRSQSESLDTQSKHEITKCPEQEEYTKDVFEIWQQHYKERCSEKQSESKMDLIREKFMEAKRLSTDEKLRQSKQFQDALEVLSSNKDLFLKFLQEPNSLFSQHLYNLQSVPPPPDSRRITVLRPSKLVDTQKKNEKQDTKPWDKNSSDIFFSPECCKTDENPMQPTRIVILKPHNIKVVDSHSHDDVFDGDPEDSEVLESREAEEEEIALRRDETLLSSVFSNGYIGDDSSFCKSEIDYAAGNLSDSEVVSPTSRHSWDYINRFNSHYATSSSRASYSPESSVCREAKKRLSERWAMMASNKNLQEQRQIQRSSSTLGDMLALSDLKKSVKPEEKKQEFIMGSNDLNKHEDDDNDNSPRKLSRSKSVPTSGVSGSLEGKGDDSKEKLVKSSFKGRVSSLFFSKNKKSSKEKSNQSKDERPRNEGSQCVEDELYRRSQGIVLPELLQKSGFSFKNPEFLGNHSSENQDQPSPISVLEPHFEEDGHTANAKLNKHDSMKYKLIDKSPPIGSISRTLSWDDTSLGSATPYSGKPSSSAPPLNPQEEEQECLLYVETLLSVAGLHKTRSNSLFARWHSPESPLDPSLRDKYMNLTEKDSILSQNKQRHHHHRSMTKLVFDCVNEALMDIGSGGGAHMAMMMTSALVGDRVWARMKEWLFSGEERWGEWDDSDGDGGSVVEEVVRKEVVGRGWVEGLRLEIDDTRKDIEGKLLEELVEESVLELTGRASSVF
ncbi:uncharacterized protein LOC111881305 isoform X1 [Lactuca sativa]|uniref:uncharacterized protein LOC111881305 isoform X1 n=1 Tax=Lactuca sativa TaxID=4236 RepID=UPI0022AF7D9C|nr:uncharacterized protein LOC111881305 isoform X1 [Lactuca sativa]XP_052623911.1 uncharacterized protein LOC111881305 isoform X1 [Lactuca sativa]